MGNIRIHGDPPYTIAAVHGGPGAAGIRCPVIAIHGDYDPHPASGVREPRTTAIKEFTFIMLSKCGHYP